MPENNSCLILTAQRKRARFLNSLPEHCIQSGAILTSLFCTFYYNFKSKRQVFTRHKCSASSGRWVLFGKKISAIWHVDTFLQKEWVYKFTFKYEEFHLDWIKKGGLDSETHVFSVPDVMSSVTRMMHLRPFTVDFQESWKRTMFGCWSPFSISTSSLKRCRSAFVSLRVCRGINTGLNMLICIVVQHLNHTVTWVTSYWFQVSVLFL